jgi:P4 family phage/plasmid primase-like protien
MNFVKIPESLKKNGLFCLRKGKIPYNPKTGNRAQANNPDTFDTFEKTLSVMQSGNYDGIGIGIYGQICAIDIDKCVTNGKMSGMAQDIINIMNIMNTYTEYSPSGEGVRILCTVKNLNYNKKAYYINNQKIGLEVYVAGVTKKYVTITGNKIPAGEFGNRDEELQIVLDKYMKREHNKITNEPVIKQTESKLSDDEISEKARTAKNGAKFSALYGGDITGYPSQSEADLALCNILAFWCGCDMVQMDRIFRNGGLYRDKWDRKQSGTTYGQTVIEQAIHNCTEVYSPVPNQKNHSKQPSSNLKPEDDTDIGQSRILTKVYGDKLRYSRATRFLCYTGTVWKESEIKAQGMAQTLTDHQLCDAIQKIMQAKVLLQSVQKSGDEREVALAREELDRAEAYRKFVLSRRNSGKISATLKESHPALEIEVEQLDADPFKLNTPAGTVDLRTGQQLPHDPLDYCTKTTNVSPNDKGKEIFKDFMKVITCGDENLEEYMQIISGMEAIGAVYSEILEIAHGSGSNGKSTYYNLKARVLGDYSGNLSAETLTVNCRKNKSPEYAELRGKRLVIAAELEEGMRLDTAIVKKLCSTDPIYAEKKYKDPFKFIPSHTVVLYTNHLPKVGTSDTGTWRRLIVIPFKAVIDGESDIKNYTEYLYQNASGAVLTWIIEGAVKFIKAGYKIDPPECVKQAIKNYRGENDWINNYIHERCETDKSYSQKSGALYSDYRDYCKSTGEYTRSASDLKMALMTAGYEWKRTNTGGMYYGLRIRSNLDNNDVSPVSYVIGLTPPNQVRVTEDYTEKQDFVDSDVDFENL